MNDRNKKTKFISSLLGMFESAKADLEKAAVQLGNPPEDFSEDFYGTPAIAQVTPQVCAFLLSTGQIVGGVASNPVTPDNRDAEDAIGIAQSTLKSLPNLKEGFRIVMIGMTTTTDRISGRPTEIDFCLFERSLSELPDLEEGEFLLLDPVTKRIAYSTNFQDYRITS